jgi:hypothetical protein
VPVNQSAGPLFEGCEPARVMFMVVALLAMDEALVVESLVCAGACAVTGAAKRASATSAAPIGMVHCISEPSKSGGCQLSTLVLR